MALGDGEGGREGGRCGPEVATPGDGLRLSRWRWETGGREGGRCGPEVVGATPGDGLRLSRWRWETGGREGGVDLRWSGRHLVTV